MAVRAEFLEFQTATVGYTAFGEELYKPMFGGIKRNIRKPRCQLGNQFGVHIFQNFWVDGREVNR